MSILRGIGGFLLGTFEQVVLAVSIFMIIYLFLLQPHQVDGISMMPNFEDGEYLLTDKITYKINNPKRGDVIVFAAPPDRQRDFIKRIIGAPGDRISVMNDRIFINDKELEEDYLPKGTITTRSPLLNEEGTITVSPNEYFVLGDNRTHSSDSRFFGLIKKKDIVGKAWLIYWPLNRIRIIPASSYAGF